MTERTRLFPHFAAVAALAIAMASSSATAEAPAPGAHEVAVAAEVRETVDRYCGKFAFAGGNKERKARDAAIDDVVGDMNVFVRGIARDRLKESNRIAEKLSVAREGDRMTIRHDGRPYTAVINGGAVRVQSSTGDDVSLRYVVGKGRIQQVFIGDQGGRTNTYSIEGDRLVVDVRIHSEKLPKDLVYRLSYQR